MKELAVVSLGAEKHCITAPISKHNSINLKAHSINLKAQQHHYQSPTTPISKHDSINLNTQRHPTQNIQHHIKGHNGIKPRHSMPDKSYNKD